MAINPYQISRRYNSQDSILHRPCPDSLKSHRFQFFIYFLLSFNIYGLECLVCSSRTPWAGDRPVETPLPKHATYSEKCVHVPSWILTHEPGVRAAEDITRLSAANVNGNSKVHLYWWVELFGLGRSAVHWTLFYVPITTVTSVQKSCRCSHLAQYTRMELDKGLCFSSLVDSASQTLTLADWFDIAVTLGRSSHGISVRTSSVLTRFSWLSSVPSVICRDTTAYAKSGTF